MKAISFLLLFFICLSCRSKQTEYDPILTPLDSRQDGFRACYLESESYQGRNSDEKGIIKALFTIDQSGKVIKAKIIQTPFKDPNFDACLLDQLRSVKFKAPKDGKNIEVMHPINFYPRTNE